MRGKVRLRENIFKLYIWKNIYWEHIKNCDNSEDKNLIFKWEDFNIHSSKGDMRMASKHKKKNVCVMLLDNCKSQSKWDYHFTTARMLIIKR